MLQHAMWFKKTQHYNSLENFTLKFIKQITAKRQI